VVQKQDRQKELNISNFQVSLFFSFAISNACNSSTVFIYWPYSHANIFHNN